ncbi:MAG: hypothetical protein II304_03565 [Bacteroidales bacterium]|nr:hypothetical protein [Bacteroidales bacterium]
MPNFKCCKCNKVIDPRKTFCPFCNEKQSFEERAKAQNVKIVNTICKNCECETSFYTSSQYADISWCAECGKETYSIIKQPISAFNVKCPYCESKNTRKITATSKAVSAVTFGIFSIGKITKEWHCNDCKSNF